MGCYRRTLQNTVQSITRALAKLAARERIMKDRSHNEAMAELFRDDPEFEAHYLDAILGDGEQTDLLVALQQMAIPRFPRFSRSSRQ